jgi:hypothetical protein
MKKKRKTKVRIEPRPVQCTYRQFNMLNSLAQPKIWKKCPWLISEEKQRSLVRILVVFCNLKCWRQQRGPQNEFEFPGVSKTRGSIRTPPTLCRYEAAFSEILDPDKFEFYDTANSPRYWTLCLVYWYRTWWNRGLSFEKLGSDALKYHTVPDCVSKNWPRSPSFF